MHQSFSLLSWNKSLFLIAFLFYHSVMQWKGGLFKHAFCIFVFLFFLNFFALKSVCTSKGEYFDYTTITLLSIQISLSAWLFLQELHPLENRFTFITVLDEFLKFSSKKYISRVCYNPWMPGGHSNMHFR